MNVHVWDTDELLLHSLEIDIGSLERGSPELAVMTAEAFINHQIGHTRREISGLQLLPGGTWRIISSHGDHQLYDRSLYWNPTNDPEAKATAKSDLDDYAMAKNGDKSC